MPFFGIRRFIDMTSWQHYLGKCEITQKMHTFILYNIEKLLVLKSVTCDVVSELKFKKICSTPFNTHIIFISPGKTLIKTTAGNNHK